MFINAETDFETGAKVNTDLCMMLLEGACEFAGLTGDVRVETAKGWTAVSELVPGAEVFTYDGGLQVLESIEKTRHQVRAFSTQTGGVVRISGGCLGSGQDTIVLANQRIGLEGSFVEELFGLPFICLKARHLLGLDGVSIVKPQDFIETYQLHFVDEEFVWANDGLLVHCAAEASRSATPDYFTEKCAQDGKLLARVLSNREQLAA